MGAKKIIAIVLLVVGIGLLVLSVVADPLGIGTPGFGRDQILGAVAGVIVAIVGLVLARRK
jgi:hypothetical protein